ncbi:hypothetical protein RHMOL_Rhmol02G0220900 [Rhododendron molle]|uniref:Uncharacterized protein n=1 Tax=Rhododendron molle TaxID=49168 RepID=A0ACC0PU61_RHOML|nr:hypothetical protein RHMOL_Rhmol02G0220900 [Rhododendron molle]
MISKPLIILENHLLSVMVVSDASIEIKRVGKDLETMANIDKVEQAECECCGLEEECTQEYIKKTKDCYSGKWVCGLCSEAVKEALVREPKMAIEEALRNQREFCQEFHSSRLNPELSLTCAMRKIAKRSCENRNYNTSSTSKIARSTSCFPSNSIDLRIM